MQVSFIARRKGCERISGTSILYLNFQVSSLLKQSVMVDITKCERDIHSLTAVFLLTEFCSIGKLLGGNHYG